MRVYFGEFVVDDQTRQLTRNGQPVHLSPKALDFLTLLIRERPNALSREDLLAKLWPEVYVSDGSLAMLVTEVRSALGETAKESNIIRTLHRHGYAFQAEAQEEPASDSTFGYWLVTPDRQVALVPGENVVGRDPKARMWIDSPSVSRRHARILLQDNRATIEDLDSKNGTFVGDKRLSAAVTLQDGAAVRFGSVDVTFRSWSAEPTRTEGDAS
jgi:DNA-binding winged helix-turn-helix (wHTH) protein